MEYEDTKFITLNWLARIPLDFAIWGLIYFYLLLNQPENSQLKSG